MKITKKQYDQAKRLLPKYERAQKLVNLWESTMKLNDFAGMDVESIQANGDGGFSATVVPKKREEEKHATAPTGGTARESKAG